MSVKPMTKEEAIEATYGIAHALQGDIPALLTTANMFLALSGLEVTPDLAAELNKQSKMFRGRLMTKAIEQ